ncbi:DUF805 domain-containing protein [Novosphingobium sp. G106]|uniref:DUF805 domain-containing protein n=1 Tax=Novosphingobium sp. G106 TaxID=2849500 RepID=UPI001C2D9E7C|nr:DUF805 domain-containing protein [Novosphingobium sp. G106]MBV1689837.1 DUF805 domain-containing protein [Novosphingobium sp. G106]
MLLASIRHCLANLFNFSGRDRQDQFWPYAGIVIGATVASWLFYGVTMIGSAIGRMQEFAQTHPDEVTVEQGPGHYSIQVHGNHPELMPDMQPFLGLVMVGALVVVVLIASAAARRLHDSNVPGWIGLIPVFFLSSGFWLMNDMFAGIRAGKEPELGRFFLTFANNAVYIACLVGVIYLLARKGTLGDNPYGPPPL